VGEVHEPPATTEARVTTEDVQRLVDEEVHRQRTELIRSVQQSAAGLVFAALSAAGALLALVFVGIAIYDELSSRIPNWAAGLVMLGLYALLAAGAFAAARLKLRQRVRR